MATVGIKTLGCKLNQYESEQIREQLERLGYRQVPFESVADLYIINSCTVTAQTDRETRRLARRAKRRNPLAFVVVTGCYAECSPETLQAIPEVDLIIGNEGKGNLASQVPQPCRPLPSGTLPAGDPEDRPRSLITQFAGHTRGFIKVQEGCNASCSYCIIPRARGRSRSTPLPQVVEQARLLGVHGHPEVVLIGIHLGQYGLDLLPPTDLASLVEALCALPEVRRLRLSSLEPREVSPALVRYMQAGGQALVAAAPGLGKVCRHLHIPLQSGCDAILQRMNRPYTCSFYAELLGRLHRLQPLAGLGADVIVGFPGETRAQFDETYAFVEQLPLSYLHVFTYSPRPGTPAAAMPDQIAPEEKLRRNHLLRALSERKRIAFAEAMVGQQLEAVLQEESGPGTLSGITDNYLEIAVRSGAHRLRDIARCVVTAAADGKLVGELLV